MYWVIGLFDKETESRISTIRKEINADLHTPSAERPHLSIGGYRELDIHQYILLMEQHLTSCPRLEITFQSIGAFMNYPALFLSPVMTKDLMHFHLHYYEKFNRFSYAANDHYLPNRWVPHCTILNHVPLDRMRDGAALFLNKYQPFSGLLTEVALVQEGGPLIHSVNLRNPPMP